EQAEIFSDDFITEVKKDNLKEDSKSKTEQMLQSAIEGNYKIDEIRDELKEYEVDDEIKENLYILYADQILDLLEKKVVTMRMISQRSISASKMASRSATKEKTKTRARKDKTEEDDFSVKKMSMEEVGEEITKREDEERKLKEIREKEEKEVAEERKKHSEAYQGAFNLYADCIELKGKDVKGINSLIEDIKRLGKDDLSSRQMSIDRLITDPNLNLAYYPIIASLRDKVIVNKVIQALGKLGDFKAVDVLIDIYMENYGEKGSGIRGIAAQAIGDIVRTLNGQEKHLGTKKIFRMVKQESFEKKLESILPNLKKDIKNSNMRKYYYSQDCLQWLLLLSNKLIVLKKKDVKAAFVKLSLSTPLSKMLEETSKEIQIYIKS
ncbi:hypothetical protein ACFL4Z_02705, partial [candidate division KSB1 bacterium]